MELIKGLTADAKQKHNVIMTDGTEFSFSIEFKEMQYGWFITEFIYGELIIRSIRVTNNYNILRQFKNQIPFGFACISDDNREPYHKEDFLNGVSKLYVLTELEVEEYEDFLKT